MRSSDELLLAVPQAVSAVVTHFLPEPHSSTLGCRVATDVLERFNVRAQPLCVSVAAFNRRGWTLYNDGVPIEQWPTDAYSVGANARLPLDPFNGKWNGYPVLVVGDRLIDISLDQLSRPQHGIVLEPSTFGLPPNWGGEGDQLGIEVPPHGVMVKYVAEPAAPDVWRTAPDWQDSDIAARCWSNAVNVLLDWGFTKAS